MNILFVTSEIAGIYKRGGLADVSYALPVALEKVGISVTVVMPFFEKISTKSVVCIGQLAVDFAGKRELVFIFRTILPHTNVPVLLIRHPFLHDYDRPHMAERFAFFAKAVAKLALFSDQSIGETYDVLHCNDWHTALIPMLIGEERKSEAAKTKTIEAKRFATILTIHNLMYQGETSVTLINKLGVPKRLFHTYQMPYGTVVRQLTEGMEYSDVVTTVSPTYAREIRAGIHGKRVVEVFGRRHDAIVGILNGLDPALWDPKTDGALPTTYDTKDVVEGKHAVKTHLRRAVGLVDSDLPLFGFVGRLEDKQKGLDLIARAIDRLPDTDYQMVLLGTGQKRLVTLFEKLAKNHHNIAFIHTFDERLARRIYAGSDIMLVPSKFEPCGLTQLIAMRYGTLPLVRRTGGLADTVTDGKSGFVFGPYTSTALVTKMQQAIAMYQEKKSAFAAMSRHVMALDFSWKKVIKEYVALYKSL